MDDTELPAVLDRRANGRCRAYWAAYEMCPGNKNPFDYATDNYHKYLVESTETDQKRGMLPCCKPHIKKSDKPIRKRERKTYGS